MSAPRTILVGCLAASFLGGIGGCTPPPPREGWHGSTPIKATYSSGRLSTSIPAGIPVESIIVAADQVLSGRGYTVTARETTSDVGRLVARPPDPRLLEKVVVNARLRGRATALTISFEPSGDEPASRAMVESMLARLGL